MGRCNLLATIAVLAFGASAADAAGILKFVLTGEYSETWKLPASPVPSSFNEASFYMDDVAGTWNGEPGSRTVYFPYITANRGSFALYSDDGADFVGSGEPLFTGSVDEPVFRLGIFVMTKAFGPPGDGILTISNAVPEPASWALMITGFGVVGATMRRGTARTKVLAA